MSTNIKVVCRCVLLARMRMLFQADGCDVCRFRPTNAIEQREGGEVVVSFDENLQTCHVRSAQLGSGPERDGFTFDRVFPPGTEQQDIFDYGVKE